MSAETAPCAKNVSAHWLDCRKRFARSSGHSPRRTVNRGRLSGDRLPVYRASIAAWHFREGDRPHQRGYGKIALTLTRWPLRPRRR